MNIYQEVVDRLPYEPVGIVWLAAERHGLPLKVDDLIELRCVDVLVSHLLMNAGYDESNRSEEALDAARLLMAVMGDGFPYWAVMVGEAFVSHLVTQGDSLQVFETWVDTEA